MNTTSRQDHALMQTICERTEALLDLASSWFAQHNASPPDPIVRFDLTGAAAGQFRWQPGTRPVLRFNLDLARLHREAFVDQTVAHEVAHLVTAICHGTTRPHGPEWRAVMTFFGQPNASRCHDFALAPDTLRRQRRWPYACDCQTHELTTTRHRRAQSGRARYHCRRCGKQLQPVGTAPC